MKPLKYSHPLALFAVIILCACNSHYEEAGSGTDTSNTVTQPVQSQKAPQEDQRNAYKMAINSLLQQDSVNGAASNDYTVIAAGMRRLDLSQCPGDFAAAYVDHLHAWEDAAQIRRALTLLHNDNNVRDVVLVGLLQKIFGSDANALRDAAETEKRLEDAFTQAQEKIRTTFQEVERIAASYGATLPKQ